MKFQNLFLLLIFASLFFACSDSGSNSRDDSPENWGNDSLEFKDDTLSNMVRVLSKNAFAYLGTNGDAKVNEKPQMKVTFDYDFSIGKTEVTCGEFKKLLKSPAESCVGDNLPIVNVTYYDAILYANALSKSENFDTVYNYSSAKFNENGSCVNLENLDGNLKIKGYRLPTEAEWVLAASKNFNAVNGWNAENSDYKIYKSCTAKNADSLKICDMAGNVMEWVNDWMGRFKDTTVANFAGAPDGGKAGERVVKGGSFRNAPSAIKIFTRGDVYTVTSNTFGDYLGFRIALGEIKNPTWMGSDGAAVESKVTLKSNASDLKKLVGTFRAKLVFRNDETGNLNYVDYGSGTLTVVEIRDTLTVYHPAISPDGKLVAFSTGFEGVAGESALYVRNLNSKNGDAANLVKLEVKSAAIPRWKILENGDTAIVYVSDAGNNKNESEWQSAETFEVVFKNGKFETPKKIFTGSFNGGVSDDKKLAVTGARLLRANVNGKNEIWYNEEQACNVSLNKNKQTLFLDFGGITGQKFANENYKTHQRILIADSVGKLLKTVKAPSGFTFDHSEWVNDTLAIATLTNINGSHTKIAVVNVNDSCVTVLAEGEELWHPDLWVNDSKIIADENLNLDSAGVYLLPEHVSLQAMYRIKMELFWKNLNQTKVLLVGSSRMDEGVNPDLYPEWDMLNAGSTGIDVMRDLHFIKNYALNHSDNLKAICLSFDMDNWRGLEDFLAVVRLAPGFDYDANHNFWKDGIPLGFLDAVINAYPAEEELTMNISERGGLIYNGDNETWINAEVLHDSIFSDVQLEFLDNVFREIEAVAEICKEQKIYFIGIIFPMSPLYKETGSFGLYGMPRSLATKKIEWLRELEKSNPYFKLMDENKMGNHDYTSEMAYDNSHLNYKGANQLTTRLDSLLKTLK